MKKRCVMDFRYSNNPQFQHSNGPQAWRYDVKALVHNGSPRQGGNTEILLGKALDPLCGGGHETRLPGSADGLGGCTACGVCKRNRDCRCVIAGDGFNEVFAAMVAAMPFLIGRRPISGT